MARLLLEGKENIIETMIEAQIISLAGQGERPEDIASALKLEKSAVEFVLSRHGLMTEEDIPKEDYREILDGIIETAKHSEHEHLKLRAGMFIVEQKRTRENLKHAPALNIMMINQLIQNAHGKVMDSLKVGSTPILIDDSENSDYAKEDLDKTLHELKYSAKNLRPSISE